MHVLRTTSLVLTTRSWPIIVWKLRRLLNEKEAFCFLTAETVQTKRQPHKKVPRESQWWQRQVPGKRMLHSRTTPRDISHHDLFSDRLVQDVSNYPCFLPRKEQRLAHSRERSTSCPGRNQCSSTRAGPERVGASTRGCRKKPKGGLWQPASFA
jgi:hypothetical protein